MAVHDALAVHPGIFADAPAARSEYADASGQQYALFADRAPAAPQAG